MTTSNLTEVLKAKGITKAELARRIGVTPQNLQRYFNGKRVPSDPTLQKIADALGMDVEVVVTFKDKTSPE